MIFLTFLSFSFLFAADTYCKISNIDPLSATFSREYYNIGDTISEEDQSYNFDVCYSDGNYDLGSKFN